MTIKWVINLDCREEENWGILQKYLKKIKPLSKYKDIEDVPIYKIEKVITILLKKYNIRIRDIVPDVWSGDIPIWRCAIIYDKTLRQLVTVYGLSLYEVLAKAAIYMYSVREDVGER